jgi:hypothetical protein
VTDRFALTGQAGIGETRLAVDLEAEVVDGDPVLVGSMAASVLRPSDLRRIDALAGVFRRDVESVSVEEAFAAGFKAEVDFAAARFAGGDPVAGDLNAHLSYADRRVVLDPLDMRLLQGRVDSTLQLDLADTDRIKAAFAGSIEQLDLGVLFDQLEAEPVVAGTMDVEFDLRGDGETVADIVRSMDGGTHVVLVDAPLGTRLIDLAGQNVVEWLFAGLGEGQPRIVCLVSGTRFTAGRGLVEGLVLETTQVQLVAGGRVDFPADHLEIHFEPRPLRPGLMDVVTPFTISGPLAAPELETGPVLGRVFAETATLPVRPLGLLLKGLARRETDREPCVPLPAAGESSAE